MIILLIVGVLLAGRLYRAAETVSMPLEEHEARQPVIDV